MQLPSRIVANTRLSAAVEAHEELVIDGHLVGSLSGTSVVTISSGGIVEADVHVKRLVVHGVVVGSIAATEAVELGATAQVLGNIRTPALSLAVGGRVCGNVKTGVSVEAARGLTGRRRASEPYSSPRPTPAVSAPEPSAASSSSTSAGHSAPHPNMRGVTMQGVTLASLKQAKELEDARKAAATSAPGNEHEASETLETVETEAAETVDDSPLETVEDADLSTDTTGPDGGEAAGNDGDRSGNRRQGRNRQGRHHKRSKKKPQNA